MEDWKGRWIRTLKGLDPDVDWKGIGRIRTLLLEGNWKGELRRCWKIVRTQYGDVLSKLLLIVPIYDAVVVDCSDQVLVLLIVPIDAVVVGSYLQCCCC